jgi:UDP-glucose 4-epimerase
MTRRFLVTGATGKVGQVFIQRLLEDPRFDDCSVRALCHNRTLESNDRVSVIKGSIEDRELVRRAVSEVTHVLHLATCKETPEAIMDVAIKGMFWLLEETRVSPSFQQFILVGGDAAVGHSMFQRDIPVTETQGHRAYPGCYALSKVMEEVMLEQYYIQYDYRGCCLRAPWIMTDDDFKYQLSFGDDVFGGPRWCDLVGKEKAAAYQKSGAVPVMLDAKGVPVKRNFVHVQDLVSALLAAVDHPAAHQQLFNVCMDEPVDYRELGNYLAETRSLPTVDVKTDMHSVWLDNAKAKLLLGWRPQYDLKRMTDEAFDYDRPSDKPRKIWYPG